MISTQDILAQTDDLFLRRGGIVPYRVESLTAPAMPTPQAPPASLPVEVRSAPAEVSCLDTVKALLVTLGCLAVSGLVGFGLVKVFEVVVFENW